MPTSVAGLNWFRAGAIGWLIFGGVHLTAVYHANFVPPASDAERALKDAALALRQKMGPFEPSAWGGLQILNTSYSILLFQAGVLSLLTATAAAAAGQLRQLACANFVFALLLGGLPLAWQFPPPTVFATIVAALFGVAAYRAARRP